MILNPLERQVVEDAAGVLARAGERGLAEQLRGFLRGQSYGADAPFGPRDTRTRIQQALAERRTLRRRGGRLSSC